MPVASEPGSTITTPTHDPRANVRSMSPGVLLTARSPTPTINVVIVPGTRTACSSIGLANRDYALSILLGGRLGYWGKIRADWTMVFSRRKGAGVGGTGDETVP
jgi:hypothetical protein